MRYCSQSRQIRNIIFDLGGVLISFDPPGFLRQLFEREEDAAFFLDHVFLGPLWAEMDRGAVTLDDGIAEYKRLHPEQTEIIDRMFAQWWDMFQPIPQSIRLARRLKETGRSLYALSNFMQVPFERLSPHWGFMPLFDGAVISYQTGHVKPEAEIYERLLNLYSLKADESLFIDDMPTNLDGARRVGLHTLLCESPDQLERDLTAMGFLEKESDMA